MDHQILHEQIYHAKAVLHELVVKDWLTNDLFSIRWYGTVAFILFSYAFVFWLLDKRRLTQLFLFGSLMTVMVTLLDVFGTQFGRWSFLTRIFPIVPSLFLYDYTIIPLYYMLVYQYSPDWKRFMLWNAIAAGIISFAVFPFLTFVEMFELNKWNYVYFFPIIFTFGMVGRVVVLSIMSIEDSHRNNVR